MSDLVVCGLDELTRFGMQKNQMIGLNKDGADLLDGDGVSVGLHVKEVTKSGEGCVHEGLLEELVGVDVLVLCGAFTSA
jgi:hypothetical protein